MGRFDAAEEMARAALFLASEDASYVTGTALTIDGGITAAYVTPEQMLVRHMTFAYFEKR